MSLAMADAAGFAQGPTQAYAAVKRAVSRGFDQPLEEGLAIEAEQFARAFASGDAKIGVGPDGVFRADVDDPVHGTGPAVVGGPVVTNAVVEEDRVFRLQVEGLRRPLDQRADVLLAGHRQRARHGRRSGGGRHQKQ